MVGFYITPPFDPTAWDGEYETLPNLVAGWLPDRGLYKDAEGTEPAGEDDTVLGWRDFVQGALLAYAEEGIPLVKGGIATASIQDEITASVFAGLDSPLAGSIVEAVFGSVPRENGTYPLSYAMISDDPDDPSLPLIVTHSDGGPSTSFMGGIAGLDDDAPIMLPEPPSQPVSLRVVGSNAELVNLSGVLGEQVGYAEPIVGATMVMVPSWVEGADNMPLAPLLLFSEPLDAETRTQLFNKLKNDFPAWS